MWKPDDWDTRSIVKRVLLSVSDSPREQTSSDMLVEAGADAMHEADVKWLKERKAKEPAAHTFNSKSVELCILIRMEDYQSFIGEK